MSTLGCTFVAARSELRQDYLDRRGLIEELPPIGLC
jgi:hypothetical protein